MRLQLSHVLGMAVRAAGIVLHCGEQLPLLECCLFKSVCFTCCKYMHQQTWGQWAIP